MSLIETVQKQILFEEAARQGIKSSQLQSIPSIYNEMLGPTDIGKRRYGNPLVPVYEARPNELIDVGRIAKYFSSLARDLKTSNLSLRKLEDNLVLFNLECWARMQLLKNRSSNLSKKAKMERIRSSLGATWLFTETFNNTSFIDVSRTTSWFDTSEGIAFLPSLGDEIIVKPSEIAVTSSTSPNGGSFIGSTPYMAFDGLLSTNWRASFVLVDSYASCTIQIPPSDLNAVTIDPVGFGIEVVVSLITSAGTTEAVRAIIYNKTTFPVEAKEIQKLHVSFKPATAVLPKVVGIRELTLLTSKTSRTSSIYSTELVPTYAFSEVKIVSTSKKPAGSNVRFYYATDSASGPWNELREDWNLLDQSYEKSAYLTYSSAVQQPIYYGLYGINLTTLNKPLTTKTGQLFIGLDQMEVTAFKKSWIENGEVPRRLDLTDFTGTTFSRAWSSVPTIDANSTSVLIQDFSSDVLSLRGIERSNPSLVFERTINISSLTPSTLNDYKQLCIVPFDKTGRAILQPDFNYKFSCKIYCSKFSYIKDAKYWFLQGFRTVGKRAFRETGKSYCSFALYVNGSLVIGETQPYTVYTDNTLETDAADGKDFTFSLNEGWNSIDILFSIVDPAFYLDTIDSEPYVQFCMSPSFFDKKFGLESEHPISSILGSGIYKPVSEFDLVWNLPIQPTFWAWKGDRTAILFNNNRINMIDGYYSGTSPAMQLIYQSETTNPPKSLYIRAELSKNDQSSSTPILEEYTVMVR